MAGRTAFALPNVITAVGAGDFEGSVLFGLGVQKQTSFHVRVQANRVVVEVGSAFPTSLRKVCFADRDANVAPVQRRVPLLLAGRGRAAVAVRRAHRRERADGLRLVRSRATGFERLTITGGIARLRLTGGCAVAAPRPPWPSEIVPTLKQFPSVDWVKISTGAATRSTPNGTSDSIPACLEP